MIKLLLLATAVMFGGCSSSTEHATTWNTVSIFCLGFGMGGVAMLIAFAWSGYDYLTEQRRAILAGWAEYRIDRTGRPVFRYKSLEAIMQEHGLVVSGLGKIDKKV